MQGFIQFILGNLWILVPILIGLFNVGVRMQQKAKEQRAKRAALAEIQRRKADSLRTGKPVNEPVIVYDEPQKKKSAQDDRQSRIEALRKQRMEQLRAMREKRAGAASTSAAPSSPTRTTQPRPLVPKPVMPQQRASQGRSPASRPRVIPPQTPQFNRGVPQRARVDQPTLRPAPIPQASPGADTPAPKPSKIKPGANPIAASKKRVDQDSLVGSDTITARELLRNRRMTRQAMVVREILDSPISMRDPDEAPGSMRS